MMKVEPRAEHHWLQRLVGEWTGESDSKDPDGNSMPPWTETGSTIGDIWVVLEGEGALSDGSPSKTRMQLGFDPEKGRFIGTWIGSMMGHMWIYDGALDGDVLTLDTEGPDFSAKGKTARYRDIVELLGHDRRVLRSEMQDDDGQWREIMRADYRRTS
jgi:hypothetical protein